jgi:putative hydrolase of the HAD superfamily
MVRALILDYGGVLTTRSPTAREDFERLVGVSMLDYRDANTRAAARLGQDPLEAVETGRITEAEFKAALAAELPSADIDAMGEAYYAQHVSNPAMIACVAGWRARGVVTMLVTNAAAEWTHHWSPTIPSMHEVFDHVVISGLVGSRKPDVGIYRHALDLLAGIASKECVFVDDSEANCATAEEVGMQAIRFTDTESAVAAVATR